MMNPYVTVIVAGLAGAAGLTTFLYFIHFLNFANGDMIRAIGSVVTRSEKNAFLVGLVAQAAGGVFFSVVYAMFVSLLPVHTLTTVALACTFFGFLHGLVLGIAICYAVAIHDSLERFRQEGIKVAVAHWFGHMIYGLIVGLVLGMSPYPQ